VPATVAGYLIVPGVYQLNLTVPAIADGNAVLSISMGGSSTQSGLIIAVANVQ
jgi:uncharacterized protein (TIGR03437 family)